MAKSLGSTVGGSRRREADASSSQGVGILAANDTRKAKKADAIATLLTEISDDQIDEVIAKLQGRKKPKKESSTLSFKTRLQESDSPSKPSRYRVVLIQEGLGNFNDAFFYTREALQSAVSEFEGKKIYANHPSRSEEEDRPERDVKDILGHYENVALEEVDGRAEVHADLVIPDGEKFDWARNMADAALTYREKYGDKDFVGLSINASGDADESDIDDVIASAPEACVPKLNEAKEKGVTTVRVVTQIDDAVSTDLVTEAGAGGKFLKLLEEAKSMSKTKVDPKKKKVVEADGGGDGEHADAEQDKELIGKMMKKHLGDKSSPEDEKECHEAYEGYKEMGMEGEEAMKQAANHTKMMKMKKEKKAKESEAEAEESESTENTEATETHESEDGDKEEKTEKKESEVVKLSGRVAFLERELKTERLAKYVDKKLAESGHGRAITDKFRKAVGALRDEKDFDAKWKVFESGMSEGATERGESFTFVTGAEKVNPTASEATEAFSAADCVTE